MSPIKTAIISLLISSILCGGFVVYYTAQQNKNWCGTLSILTRTNPNEAPPASTPYGKLQRQDGIDSYAAIKVQMHKFHCGGE